MLTVVRKVSWESWAIAIICMADLFLTIQWVKTHAASEGNPLMNYYLQHGLGPFIAMKMILVAGPLIILEYARSVKPDLVKRYARLTIAAYLGIYGILFLRVNVPTLAEDDERSERYDHPASPSSYLDRMRMFLGEAPISDPGLTELSESR